MSKLNFAMFLAGATVGAAGAWFCCKRYYERIAQEEIDSVKAAFAERKPYALKNVKNFEDSTDDNEQKANMAKLKPDLISYAAKLQAEGYTNYSAHAEKILTFLFCTLSTVLYYFSLFFIHILKPPKYLLLIILYYYLYN